MSTNYFSRIYLFAVLFFYASVSNGQTGDPATPHLFGEGIISTQDYETHPAFSPTGDTLYFVKCSSDLSVSAICVSYKTNGKWSKPEMASFSGKYFDTNPFVAKDGHTIYLSRM